MANSRICAVDGCGKKLHSRDYCGAHYYKFKVHGDPLGGRRGASPGAPFKWLNQNKDYAGDACLIWPFERTRWGYGTIKRDGKKRVCFARDVRNSAWFAARWEKGCCALVRQWASRVC